VTSRWGISQKDHTRFSLRTPCAIRGLSGPNQ
jgi:hypothetical protein